jgi:MerR family transcriptional regulator, Zn(II)-responsive regulator of zntA
MLRESPERQTSTGGLHVTELARKADVTPTTVRYYARMGLLKPDRERGNGYRRFSGTDLRRVNFVRRAQALGLTIGDAKAILQTVDHGDSPCPQVRKLVAQRLTEVRARLAELQAMERRISAALETWSELDDASPESDEFCPLIERAPVNGAGCGVAARRNANGGSSSTVTAAGH